MVTVSKVISTSYNPTKHLVVKVLGRGAVENGRGDFKQAKEAGPFGMDSRMTADKRVLFMRSEVYGKYYVIGTLNTERLAAEGETRLFCTDANGNFKFNVWLRADGTVLIGDSNAPAEYTNYAVMFNELKTGFDQLRTQLNNVVTAYNAHTHVSPPAPVNPVTTATPLPLGVAATATIDSAKNAKVKFPA